ncbi:hypothetical protein B0T20DRAFT_411934 [Sordaria brevicollis]|uniref:Uncharacterized protein n=1 Tax=Sordaria brevicollis TaxID=83679 RepID=A0AAE0PF01_SORBR|nr:hypothetical protein B0T20DRAFT_411934 [Sordaria brevicollis]
MRLRQIRSCSKYGVSPNFSRHSLHSSHHSHLSQSSPSRTAVLPVGCWSLLAICDEVFLSVGTVSVGHGKGSRPVAKGERQERLLFPGMFTVNLRRGIFRPQLRKVEGERKIPLARVIGLFDRLQTESLGLTVEGMGRYRERLCQEPPQKGRINTLEFPRSSAAAAKETRKKREREREKCKEGASRVEGSPASNKLLQQEKNSSSRIFMSVSRHG